MSDIFREVEEDVRRERAQQLWKAYGHYAIAAAILLFLSIGGWQLWQRHDQQQREALSDRLIAAERITNPQAAAAVFADIAKDGTKGYAQVARLAQAGAMLAAGQRGEAIDLYKQIAAQDSGAVGAVARLRAAWALVDNAPRSTVAQMLAPLTDPGSAWRENANEILAYADYRALDLKSAQEKYAALAADVESPDALRARAKAMAAFLKSGGAVTYGAVPPPAMPVPNAATP